MIDKLKKVKTIDQFEYTDLLAHYVTQDGRNYLSFWADFDKHICVYLVFAVDEIYPNLSRTDIWANIRDTVLSSPDIWICTGAEGKNVSKMKSIKVAVKDIPDGYLPGKSKEYE